MLNQKFLELESLWEGSLDERQTERRETQTGNNQRLNYASLALAFCVKLQQLGKYGPVKFNWLLNHKFQLIQLVQPCGSEITGRKQSEEGGK